MLAAIALGLAGCGEDAPVAMDGGLPILDAGVLDAAPAPDDAGADAPDLDVPDLDAGAGDHPTLRVGLSRSLRFGEDALYVNGTFADEATAAELPPPGECARIPIEASRPGEGEGDLVLLAGYAELRAPFDDESGAFFAAFQLADHADFGTAPLSVVGSHEGTSHAADVGPLLPAGLLTVSWEDTEPLPRDTPLVVTWDPSLEADVVYLFVNVGSYAFDYCAAPVSAGRLELPADALSPNAVAVGAAAARTETFALSPRGRAVVQKRSLSVQAWFAD